MLGFDFSNIHIKKHEEKKDGLVHNSVTGAYEEKVEKADYLLPERAIAEQDEEDDSGDEEEEPIVEKSDMLWPSLADEEDDDDEETEHFKRDIPIFINKAKADEHVCYGVVYEPDTVDAQGDSASAEEIQKAAYYFMEHVQKFKVMHRGKAAKIKVLESYVAPQDMTIAKKTIKKGSWVLVTRVLDKKLWEDIKSEKYTGYSMAGYAKVS